MQQHCSLKEHYLIPSNGTAEAKIPSVQTDFINSFVLVVSEWDGRMLFLPRARVCVMGTRAGL